MLLEHRGLWPRKTPLTLKDPLKIVILVIIVVILMPTLTFSLSYDGYLFLMAKNFFQSLL